MSMSRTALKLVQKSLPRFRLCKDMLVLPPTEHVLRAYEFERTPYKETFYLWRMVVPLYRPQSHLILNYSKRVPRGDYVHLSKQSPRSSAAVITKIISDDLPNLERIRTPHDFLDHISWMIGNDTPKFLFDLALTYFLAGRLDDALVTLEQTVVAAERLIARCYFDSPNIPRLKELRRTANDFAAAVKSDPEKVAEFISACEQTNIAQFGLAETTLAA